MIEQPQIAHSIGDPMLVLNRKAGEAFTIDGQIKIKILGSYGNVRVGIDAPKHLRIVRDEVLEKGHCNKNKILGNS